MAQLPMGTYLGTPEPKASPFGRPSALFTAEPTTAEVAGAFIKETFIGEGSLAQDIEASNVRKQERRGDAISVDDWKTSDNFREGLTFYDTMTNESASTLARLEDDRNDRKLIISKASKLQTALGFGLGFISGVVEPKNLATGVIAAMATGGAGVLIPSMGRMIAVNTVKGAAIRGGVEGVAAAALTEPSNLESSKVVQGDYTMADSLINLTLGSVLGAGLGGGVKAFQLRGKAKVDAKGKELAEAYRAETDSQALKEMDTALSQTVQGTAIEVGAVKQADAMQAKAKAAKQLPKIEEKIAAQGDAPPISRFPEKVGIGPTSFKPTPIRTGGRFFRETNADSLYQLLLDNRDGAVLPGTFVTDNVDLALGQGKNKKVLVEFEDASLSGELHKKPGIEFVEGNEYRVNYISQNAITRIDIPKEQVKFFRKAAPRIAKQAGLQQIKNEDGSLTFKKTLGGLDTLEGKRAVLQANARQQIDTAPIQKLQDQIAKPDNSTAYDPKAADAVTKEVDEFGNIDDQIALERELEDMQEQVAELLDQGLLSKDEIATIEKLAAIDEESLIFDNVLLDARLCLTRG